MERQDQSDKRRYPRANTPIPVRYRKLGQGEEEARTMTVSTNISEGGVCFSTNEFISRACRLIVELDMPENSKSVKTISKIAWIKKSENDFEVGNQFLEMSKKDKLTVSSFVEKAISSASE